MDLTPAVLRSLPRGRDQRGALRTVRPRQPGVDVSDLIPVGYDWPAVRDGVGQCGSPASSSSTATSAIPSASVIFMAADSVRGVPITGATAIRMFWT